jgi:hypothetical protein
MNFLQNSVNYRFITYSDSVLASSGCPINAIDIVILSQFKIKKFSCWRRHPSVFNCS